MTELALPPAETGATPPAAVPADQTAPATPPAAQTEGTPAQPEAAANEGETQPKPPTRFQQRIDELTRAKHEQARQAQLWESIARQQAAALQTPLPAPEQFPSQEDYQAALVERAVARQQIAQNMAQAQIAEANVKEASFAVFAENMAALQQQIPDIGIAMALPAQGGPEITTAMADVIMGTDNGPLVAYWLAKNPQENQRVARLSEMNPLAAAVEIGRISARLTSQPMRRVSQAPAPVQTAGGTNAVNSPDPSKMSFAEYEKWRANGGG